MSLSAETLRLSRAGRLLLDGLSLTIRPGEILGVLGPNGAGKSSLLACLAGVLRPDCGRVAWEGRDLSTIALSARPRHIGYAPQKVEPAWAISVSAMLETALDARGVTGRSAVGGLRQLLADFELDDLATRPITQLSGGETKRLTLACAVAGNPSVWLLDEPFAALDLGHQLAICEWLRERARAGQAIAISLHDLNDAMALCDTVLVLGPRGTAKSGTPKDVLTPALIGSIWNVAIDRVELAGGATILRPRHGR